MILGFSNALHKVDSRWSAQSCQQVNEALLCGSIHPGTVFFGNSQLVFVDPLQILAVQRSLHLIRRYISDGQTRFFSDDSTHKISFMTPEIKSSYSKSM